MAEMVFMHLARESGRGDELSADSAATDTDAIGCGIHRGTRNALVRNRIPFTEHYARLVEEGDFRRFDLIVCMDDENVRHLARSFGREKASRVRKLLSFCGESRDVADPWYTGNFDETFEDVMRGCSALLAAIPRPGPAADGIL